MSKKVAIIGATGLVGSEMLKVLEELNFPLSELILIASPASVGKEISFRNKRIKVIGMQEGLDNRPEIALFSAGGETSRLNARKFTNQGCVVIDNSSCWRMDKDVPLIVPEINGHLATKNLLIANPNCSTIQLVIALKPIHDRYGLERIVVSTYQSVTGTGKAAVDQLNNERNQKSGPSVYPQKIDMNCIPHCDVFLDNQYTREEEKLVRESRKILGIPNLRLTATAVRVPVVGGHSESVNIELQHDFNIEELRGLLSSSPGIVIQDDPKTNLYPTPLSSEGKNDVFIGRIRRDHSNEKSLNIWICSDNLRKGAATNAIQIAKLLLEPEHIKA